MVWKTSAHLARCPIAAVGQITALPDPFSECLAAWGQDSLSIHVTQWEESGLSGRVWLVESAFGSIGTSCVVDSQSYSGIILVA